MRIRLAPIILVLAVILAGPGTALAGAGGGSGGSSGEGSGVVALGVMVVFGVFVGGGFVVAVIKARRRAEARRAREAVVAVAAVEAAADDAAFDPAAVRASATQLYLAIQRAWSADDRATLRGLLGADVAVEWDRRLDDFHARGWRNQVDVRGPVAVEWPNGGLSATKLVPASTHFGGVAHRGSAAAAGASGASLVAFVRQTMSSDGSVARSDLQVVTGTIAGGLGSLATLAAKPGGPATVDGDAVRAGVDGAGRGLVTWGDQTWLERDGAWVRVPSAFPFPDETSTTLGPPGATFRPSQPILFDAAGHGVTLDADAAGVRASAWDPVGPRVAFGPPPSAERVAGRELAFDVRAVDAWAGLDGAPLIDYGDGSAPTTAKSHSYSVAGRYRVTVVANDLVGNFTTLTKTLRIRAAEAAATPTRAG